MEPFLGQIAVFAFGFAPQGWLPCNGNLLPISQYTALFSLLGTAYGGNGKTNFALPDLQGRMPVGCGQGSGLPNRELGEQWDDVTEGAADLTEGGSRQWQSYLALSYCIAVEGIYPSRP